MHDTIVIVCAAFTVVLAIVHVLLSWFKWREAPDIVRVAEIVSCSILLNTMIRIARITWQIPPQVASDEEKLNLLLADLVLLAIFSTTMARLFKPRAKAVDIDAQG